MKPFAEMYRDSYMHLWCIVLTVLGYYMSWHLL